MKIGILSLVVFSIFLLVSCAPERKIYAPDKAVETEANVSQQKAQPEEKSTLEEETLSTGKLSELIKRLQESIPDIHFDYDKYDIRQSDIQTLKKVAEALRQYPKLRLIIEGHCDERGTNEYNFALGQKRANAAKQFLVTLGIVSSRIEIISYGEEKPLCTEHSEDCWQKNRRAHFVFIEEGK